MIWFWLQFVHVLSVVVGCYGEIPPDVLLIGGVCWEEGMTPRWPDLVVPVPTEMSTTLTAVHTTALSTPAPVIMTTGSSPRTVLPG